MSFKKFLFGLFLNMMVFSFVCLVTKAIVLPSDMLYLFASLLIVSGAMMLFEPVLKFLTVRRNFLTQWLMMSVFVFLAVYLLNSIMPMFTVQSFATRSETVQLMLTGTTTIVFVSILTGFLSAIFTALND